MSGPMMGAAVGSEGAVEEVGVFIRVVGTHVTHGKLCHGPCKPRHMLKGMQPLGCSQWSAGQSRRTAGWPCESSGP